MPNRRKATMDGAIDIDIIGEPMKRQQALPGTMA
jgi:hypothetical protein